MSEIKVNSVVNSTGDNDSGLDLSTNDNIKFKIANAEKAIIDASGNLGIGTSSPSQQLHLSGSTPIIRITDTDTNAYGEISSSSSDGNLMFFADQGNTQANTTMRFSVDAVERMRIDSNGHLMVAKTSSGGSNIGAELRSNGRIFGTSDGAEPLFLNRLTDDGTLITFRKDSSEIGTIKCNNGNVDITSGVDIRLLSDSGGGFRTGTSGGNLAMIPLKNGSDSDNTGDIGIGSVRFDDIFATNGTIQTSDQNEKEDIASATTKELNVAKKLSALFKTFRWKDKVAEKGDKARTHTGIVAQEVQTAFKAEGLDASNYGLFTSDTWWEKEISVDAVKADKEKGIEAKDAYTYKEYKYEKTDGYTERTRLGVRYPELFSFIFSSIEARLTALESK